MDHPDAASGPAEQTPMSQVGGALRAARLRLGWALPEVAQSLRIRLPYLQALEEGRIADLPGSAYAVGFLRAYAQALGLDPDEMVRRFRAEAQEEIRKPQLDFPVPVSQRGVPAGAVVLLGLVVAVGAYGAWYKISSGRGVDTEVPAVPERLANVVAPAAGGVSPQVASILPPGGAAAVSGSGEGVAPVAGSPLAGSTMGGAQAGSVPLGGMPLGSGTSAQAAPMPAGAIPVPVPVPVSLVPPPAAVANAPVPPPGDVARVVLRFKADSYIQVREKSGPVLLNRVMRAGETWPVPKEQNLVLLTGNAGGTEILVDGIAAAPLGAAGAVKRDVSLEPGQIKLPPGVKLPANGKP